MLESVGKAKEVIRGTLWEKGSQFPLVGWKEF